MTSSDISEDLFFVDAPNPSEPISVLLVDDETGFVELAAESLEAEDTQFSTITAKSANEGLRHLETSAIDCVVSDYRMPKMNGLEFLSEVRNSDPALPYILLTGRGTEEIASKAISAGATEYLRKHTEDDPFTVLANRIHNAVRQNRSERQLKESHNRYQRLLANIPGMTYRCHAESNRPLITVSESSYELTGYDPESLIEDNFCLESNLVHPEDRTRIRESIASAIESQEQFSLEYRIQTAKNKTKWVHEQGQGVYENGAAIAIEGFISDVTDRKEREEQLRLYKYAYTSSLSGIAIATLDGEIRLVNPAFCEMWGYDDQNSIQGRHVTEFWTHPENVKEVVDALHDTGEWAGGLRAQRQDGTTFNVYCSASTVYDDTDDPIALMSSFTDITERRQYEAELEQLNEELEVLNRVVRHDIRNDMAVVLGWSELLDEHVDNEGEEYLEKIQMSGEHIIELTDIARDYVNTLAGDEEAEIKPIPIGSIVENEVTVRQEAHPEAEITINEPLPNLEVQATEMLSSIFRNLINNAIQHNDTETPVVEISVTEQPEEVRVTVADNGPGISKDQRETIFGKGERGLDSSGTGIGLYLVQKLIDQYKGQIWIEDNDPDGAVFIVTLPKTTS